MITPVAAAGRTRGRGPGADNPDGSYPTGPPLVILEPPVVNAPIAQESTMILTVSGVVLLGIIAFLFFRKDGLKISHAIVCSLFGFYLASTAIAPSIRAGGESLAGLIGGIKL